MLLIYSLRDMKDVEFLIELQILQNGNISAYLALIFGRFDSVFTFFVEDLVAFPPA